VYSSFTCIAKTAAYSLGSARSPAPHETKAKPRHFLQLSCSPTPTHRIFCNAILFDFVSSIFYPFPRRQVSCQSPLSADLGWSQVLLKALSQRSTSGSNSLPCADMSEPRFELPSKSPRRPCGSSAGLIIPNTGYAEASSRMSSGNTRSGVTQRV
jgi:hypothetical protein